MLSNKDGGVAPADSKAPLLALMTPGLRSLFEGTVEPLLEILRLRDELAEKERAVGPALIEMEAPVIDDKDQDAAAPTQQQLGPSWLVRLLTQHTDCASVVLDFHGSNRALRGIGATAPALRAGVKVWLPRLALKSCSGSPSVAWLNGFGHLRHLYMGGYATMYQHERMTAKLVEAGLPARLQSFSYHLQNSSFGYIYGPLLVDHAWPQLRAIFAAAGPGLTSISITNGLTMSVAVRLLAENDYAWAPVLQSLDFDWKRPIWSDGAQPLGSDTFLHVVEGLSRLPALKSLSLDAVRA